MEKSWPSSAFNASTASGPRRPWQGTVLAGLSIAGMVIIFLVVMFIIILGYKGFAAGEMGTMIGLLAASGLIFLIPLFVVIMVLAFGFYKGKKWAVVLALVFTGLGIPGAFYGLTKGLTGFLLAMLFCAPLLWIEITCLMHPYYQQQKDG